MKVLILGAGGMLGSELARQLQNEQLYAWDREELDVTNAASVKQKITELKPDLIFNCVAYNAVDKAEEDQNEVKKAELLNSDAVGFIAAAAQAIGAVLVHYSSGYVFDGENAQGYAEDAKPNPQSFYGRTKLAGEQQAEKCQKHYIVRLNLLFGKPGTSPETKKSFPEVVSNLVERGKKEMDFISDEVSTPTYAPDLAAASIKLVKEKYPYGIYHLPNDGTASWFDYANEIIKIKPADVKLNGVTTAEFLAKNPPQAKRASRPHYSVLLNTKFPKLRPWQEALQNFLTNH